MTQPIDYQLLASPKPPSRFGRSVFAWVLFVGLAIMLFMLLNHNRKPFDSLPLSTFKQLLEEDSVAMVTVEGDALYGQLKPNKLTTIVNFRTELPQHAASSWAFTQWLLENRGNAVVDARNNTNLLLQVVVPLIPWLLIFGFIWFFVFRQLRAARLQNDLGRIIASHERRPNEAGAV